MERTKVALLVSILVLSMIFAAAPANATIPTPISGEWKSRPDLGATIIEKRAAGANIFYTFHNHAEYYAPGDIIGLVSQTISITFHYKNPKIVETIDLSKSASTWPATEWSWNVERDFTGTVLDSEIGTFHMHLVAKGIGKIGAPEVIEGTWTIISGTEGLANLHGQGTWHNHGVQLNGYEGQVHFDP